MTDLVASRGPGPTHVPTHRERAVVVAAVAAAMGAAGVGLVIALIAVLLVWTTAAHSGESAADPVRGAARLWLYAHFGTLALPSGPLGLLPLGFAALPTALLWRAGAGLTRTRGVRDRAGIVIATATLVVSYAGLAALLAAATAGTGARGAPLHVLAGAGLLALAAGGGGLVRGGGLAATLRGRVGPVVAAVLTGAAGGLLALAAGSALLAASALATSLSDAAALQRALHPGPVGGAALFIAGLAAVPNAVVWAAAYAVGPGFAVGIGTAVSPFAVTLGAVPAFPMLAALPDGAAPPAVAPLVLALPLAAAGVTGGLVQRRLAGREVRWVAVAAAAAGGSAGLLLGLAAALAGGPLAAGRLAVVGPSPWQVALAAGLELAAGAAGTVGVAHALRARRAT